MSSSSTSPKATSFPLVPVNLNLQAETPTKTNKRKTKTDDPHLIILPQDVNNKLMQKVNAARVRLLKRRTIGVAYHSMLAYVQARRSGDNTTRAPPGLDILNDIDNLKNNVLDNVLEGLKPPNRIEQFLLKYSNQDRPNSILRQDLLNALIHADSSTLSSGSPPFPKRVIVTVPKKK